MTELTPEEIAHAEQEKCDVCDGTGKVPRYMGGVKPCPDPVECRKCNGTGKRKREEGEGMIDNDIVCSLIEERDDAEQAASHMYYLVTGESPEWSNLFGYQQAYEEINQVMNTLKAAIIQREMGDELAALRELENAMRSGGTWLQREAALVKLNAVRAKEAK